MKTLGVFLAAAVIGVFGFFASFFHKTPPQPIDAAPSMETAVEAKVSTPAKTVSTTTPSSTKTTATAPTTPTNTTPTNTESDIRGSGVDLTKLPLGDGKYTTSGPKKGYIYLCHIATGGQGAPGTPSWIHGSTWNANEKVAVQGSVSWPQAFIHIVLGSMRTITTNDLPVTHTTGVFPIAPTDPAYQYDRNPSSIKEQSYNFSLPENSTISATPNCIYGEVGVMTSGVLLFDAFDALYRDAVAHEEQDSCYGHPNEQGYHYHGLSPCLKNATASTVIGWAFDGFPITGPYLPNGTELATADLDECHGMTSVVSIDGKDVSTYHYVMTRDFPYSVSCFKGTSYEPKPGGGRPR